MGHNIMQLSKYKQKTYFSLLFSFYSPNFSDMSRFCALACWFFTRLNNVEGFCPRFSLSVHKKYSGGRYIKVVPDS